MRPNSVHIAIALVFLLVYASVQMASSLFRSPAPAHPRTLPPIDGAVECDVAAGVARLLDTWSPPSVEDVDDFVLSDDDRRGVDRLRELSRCNTTHPLPGAHMFPVFSGLRVLEAHALAEHRAGRDHEALQVLIDGWALAQNVGHDYAVSAMVGLASQTAILTRLDDVATQAGPAACLGPALRGRQVSARFVSPSLRLEREGGGPDWHDDLRTDWRMWAIWSWSEAEARRAAAELESLMELPASERSARAEAITDGASWWDRVTLQDWAGRGLRSMASDAAESQTEMEQVRGEALQTLRDCVGGS